MENDHLIETFYITKPRFQTFSPNKTQEKEESFKNIEQDTNKNYQENFYQSKTTKQIKQNRYEPMYGRQLRMISKQVNCSAAVNIHPIKKRRKKEGKRIENPKDKKFMNQFQQFFKSFVPNKEDHKGTCTSIKRNSSKSKTRLIIPQTNPVSIKNQSQETDSDEDFGKVFTRNQNKGHLTFYEKLKSNLEQKVEHLVGKDQKERYKKIETKAKSNKSVQRLLKEKNDQKSCESHLRLSRTGLVIRLDAMQQKPCSSNFKKIENQKAKKDMMFQRCLVKNCQIVLQNIKNYEQENLQDKGAKTAKNHKRYNSTITQKTFSSLQKCNMEASSSVQDLQMLKWRERCMNIELTCKRSTSNSINLKQGMKVFKKYSNKLHKKFDNTQKTITTILQQNCEKDEEACKLYDSMANIQPINNYIQSLQ